jgi:hypothetical protein
MDILLALLVMATGLILLFNGYALARFLIPVWGFISGLALGGAVMADLSDTPFLATVSGLAIGLLVGAGFALFAYFYYAAAVIIAAGAIGYWLGSSLIQFTGIDPGFLSTTVGIAVGALAGFAALLSNAPKYVLIVLTAVAGAVTTIGGVMLLFNVVPVDYFSYTLTRTVIHYSLIWTLAMIALAVVGMVLQSRQARQHEYLDAWSIEAGHSHHPTTTPHATPSH